MLRIEAGLILLALLIAAIRPSLGDRWFGKWERRFSALAQRRGLSVFLVGLLTLVLRVAVLPVEPIPEPIVHDEFGYLLAADTFAHGRLTNPTPPMWEHFETFSILMKPTYQCFAQPAQGMVLALGKVLFGHPFWGVWLSCGLMCAAITWMLQGWFSSEWALLGGVLSVVRYGVFGYWADSYWGGALGAVGGALVLGALPRIKESQRVRDAVLMGIGLAVLANSRPYEGFVLGMAVAILLLGWMIGKNRPPLPVLFKRVVIPLTLLLTLTAIGLGYYFWRVTGDPLRMPYQVERATYGAAPLFRWQPVSAKPAYRHQVMERMYVHEEFEGYKISRSPLGLLAKIYLAWSFFLGPALTIPFLMLAVVLPSNFSPRHLGVSSLELLFVLGIFATGQFLETFYGPRYTAPATGLVLTMVLLALRRVRQWGGSGIFLSRTILITCAISFVFRAAALPLHFPLRKFYEFPWHQSSVESFGRAVIQNELGEVPGKHLVIVHYGANHEPFAEWVYNDADIDNSKIVWAREMSPSADEQLINFFKDRLVWVVDADARPPILLRCSNHAEIPNSFKSSCGLSNVSHTSGNTVSQR